MNPVILFRPELKLEEEILKAQNVFPVITHRSEVQKDDLIIGRYSVLPFYKEFETDVNNLGGKLINSYKQHSWIADFQWYYDLEKYTFKTYFESNNLPEGRYVVKGRTNSKKQLWDTMMFAENKKQAIEIGWKLMQDPLISQQGVVYREYIPLETYEIGINGMRFTNEWRFFFYKDTLLTHAYYWGIAQKTDYQINKEGLDFAQEVASVIKDHVNFYVIDIAQKETGEWILVEINDGQMSGLSENDPLILYGMLKLCLDKELGIKKDELINKVPIITHTGGEGFLDKNIEDNKIVRIHNEELGRYRTTNYKEFIEKYEKEGWKILY